MQAAKKYSTEKTHSCKSTVIQKYSVTITIKSHKTLSIGLFKKNNRWETLI